ncbi:DUF421 domain-containing protein [Pseudobacteroides cellulosolvens]|uniref:YetF C-terminal domain-containing protein n=1 Tax=Pseudobacteroides cellulosolvens ATCC 35603 = DSM 2933 TaxID=398512 RepID=A0A0L6JSZ5_9FIRM|nr:DUF421 domain-containing protein [Pseudobacteroides cellulosolvens]KNY28814.1 protein of unknown function DUF421 [Pseudobacteroides cellulosolvens ATCC 35603 = DSM 2933]
MDQLILVSWKSALIFAMLVILSRSIGRKLLAQMSYFDFTVAITIGSISGSYVVQMVKGMWVLIAPILLALLAIFFDYIHLKGLRIRKIAEGEPVVVIQNGQVMEKNMLKLRYHLDNLESQLRDKGIFDFNEVEFAVLEPHGQLSVLKKSQYLPITPDDMNINTKYKGLSTEIIKDGKVLEKNLRQNNLSNDWLNQELKNRNISNISDIMYAALNTSGVLYVSLKQSKFKYIQKVED